MNTDHIYVVLHPKGRGNPTDHHLVVHVREWVAVFLGEKEHYVFANEHEDYDSAAADRNQRNRRPEEYTPCPSPTTRTSGVVFTKPRQDTPKGTSPTSPPVSVTG